MPDAQDEFPPSIPTEFSALFDELSDNANAVTRRLGARLHDTVQEHDLRRRELLDAQREVSRQARTGTPPNPTEYWQQTALPRAAVLVDAAMAAVVEEGEQLGGSLDHFMLEFDARDHPWTRSDDGRAAARTFTSDAIEGLLHVVPSDAAIHALGVWWQRRVRRTAVLRSVPTLIRTRAEADLVIGSAEMELLDNPPWTHGDRLLSAFELAHSEIRTQTELVVEGLTTRVSRRGRNYLSAADRVTIELRD